MTIDALDGRLITLLTEQPQIGVLGASRALGVARGTVQARLDRLVDRGVITTMAPQVDPAALGFPVTAFCTLEIRQGRGHDPVVTHLSGIPEVLEAHTITGFGRPVDPGRGPGQHRPAAGDRPGRRRGARRAGLHRDRPGQPDRLPDPAAGAGRATPGQRRSLRRIIPGRAAAGTCGGRRPGRRPARPSTPRRATPRDRPRRRAGPRCRAPRTAARRRWRRSRPAPRRAARIARPAAPRSSACRVPIR